MISYKTLPTADFHRRVSCEIYHDAPLGAFNGYSHLGFLEPSMDTPHWVPRKKIVCGEWIFMCF